MVPQQQDCNVLTYLVAGGAQLLKGEHRGDEGLVVEEGVESRAKLLLDGGGSGRQIERSGVEHVEPGDEVDGRARVVAACLAGEQRVALQQTPGLKLGTLTWCELSEVAPQDSKGRASVEKPSSLMYIAHLELQN